MKITDLKPGMIVYDVHKYKMGNTMISTVGIWEVEIKRVDIEEGIVTARWNYNSEGRYFYHAWSKWRKNKPRLIPIGFGGHRLAKRGEGK